MSKTVAFFGLGHMGGPMAANLVKADCTVMGFDPVAALMDIATSRGVGKASSLLEALAGADYVLSMLPNGENVEALYIDREKLLDHIAKTTLVIDCSTVAASSSRRLIMEAQQRGLKAIEAQVSGAVAGTLSFICGGEAANVERAGSAAAYGQ